MKTPKQRKLYNVVQYYGNRKVATLNWNIPYALAKFKKRVAEIDKNNPKGTYFKLELNK